ncbi:MAG: CPBP family intramembrane metalloprotease [Anaerolineae bacterium]|nr:CPBP family intramembrane metalloprotease [Anaerolineae bacterium]
MVLYLVAGFGLFLLASFGMGFIFTETSILASLTFYLLDFFILCGAVYALGVRRGKLTCKEMGFLPPRVRWQWLLVAVVASAILIPLRMVLGYIILLLAEGGIESVQARADVISVGMDFSWINFLLTLLGAGLLAPISEELYFRGLLHGWFKSRRFALWLRVLLSSALFGLAHFDSLAVAASSFVLGVANALLYERSKSIWIPIAMHILTNSTAVILLYLALAVMEYFPVIGG